MLFLGTITSILFGVALFIAIISSLPLYFSVRFLGGKTSIFKVIVVNIIVALLAMIIKTQFHTWAGTIFFILMIWVYKDFFALSWVKALLAWLLQFVIATFLAGLSVALFGTTPFA